MSVGFDSASGLIIVRANLRGPDGLATARLALDTGAVSTVIAWHIAVFLGYDPATAGTLVQMTTGSGVEHVPRITVQAVEALDHVRHDFPIVVHTLPPTASVDGVLGLDFLRGLCLTVDFRQGLLTLE